MLPNLDKYETFEILDEISWIALFIICIYELILEGSAIYIVGPKAYLKSMTRLIKLISPTLMLIIIFWDKNNLHEKEYFWTF